MRTVKCVICGKKRNNDDAIYIGGKPTCSVRCARKQIKINMKKYPTKSRKIPENL